MPSINDFTFTFLTGGKSFPSSSAEQPNGVEQNDRFKKRLQEPIDTTN